MAVTKSLPAPVEGWDTREALADMPEKRAVILDNWFPSTDKVIPRRGFEEYGSGMSGDVDSLFAYIPRTGIAQMFAANAGNFYDVSTGGSVGAPVATGFTNDRWQTTQIGTTGGYFLLGVNGEDTAQLYDGTTWANATMTGVTLNRLAWCNTHQRRPWFGERDSLTAYYLAVNSITGAASGFSLDGICKLGGYLMGMASWTRDSGDGADDVAVFVTSEGEAAVYQGDDPSDANSWALIGVFRIGKPLGRRFFQKAGADLLLMTEDGAVFASSILSLDRSQAERVALTQQVNKAFNDAVRENADFFGWEPFLYPRGTALFLNSPTSAAETQQFVFNTITQAPARYTNINAVAWCLFNDIPYFSTHDGRVMRFDNVNADDGDNIEYDALQAFSPFDSPGTKKYFKLAEPIFESGGSPNAAVELCVDFQIQTPSAVPTAQTVAAARWGIDRWGIGKWGSDGQIYKGWRGIRGAGFYAALRVRISSNSTRPSWIATKFVFQPSQGKNL